MVIEELDDIKLIENISSGDSESELILYGRYRDIIYNYIRKQYSGIGDIDDNTSEVLIKIFLSLKKYDPQKGKFKTWAITIAKNYMIDKSRSVEFTYSSNTISYDVADCGFFTTSGSYNLDNVQSLTNGMYGISTSSCDISNYENINAVSHLTNSIDTNDFNYLNMHYSLGYSYDEIGAEFNITSSTVSNRVNYIKSKLKTTISEEML